MGHDSYTCRHEWWIEPAGKSHSSNSGFNRLRYRDHNRGWTGSFLRRHLWSRCHAGKSIAAGLSVSGVVASAQCGRTIEAPLPDAAGVHVDKIRMRIVTYAATAQCQRRSSKFQRINAGHAQVDRFRLNVQAVFGDAGGGGAQRLVCRGSAVAADDVYLAVGTSYRCGEIGE